jgi:hypothetical protein
MYDAADEVRIRRLSLYDPLGRSETVRAALSAADWPPTDAGEVLVLRRLRVTGKAGEIGALAAAEARTLAARAVDGDDPRAQTAEAVRFRSRDHLLACLTADLIARRAASLWFWRSFSDLFALAPAAATVRALAHEPLALPAVASRLAGTATWSTLWQTIGADEARGLLAAVWRETGWPALAGGAPAAPSFPPRRTEVRGDALPSGAPHLTVQDGPPLPAGLKPDDPRVRLAAVIVLWRRSPQVLARPDGATALAGVAWALSGSPDRSPPPSRAADATPRADQTTPSGARSHASQPATKGSPTPKATTPPTRPALPASGPWRAAAPVESAPTADSGTAIPSRANERPPLGEANAQARRPVEPQEGRQVPATVPDLDATRISREAETPAPSAETDHERRLITGFGGLFYLLNLLALPTAQAELAADQRPGISAGWVWLYQLGRALGCTPDEPLTRFLAAEAGLTDPQGLATQEPAAALPALLRLGAARYGEAVFNPALCAQPALTVTTRSHLDVHYRTRDLRLDVRRVALDVDPGWLPWLGRVVRFHYGQVPELEPWEGP